MATIHTFNGNEVIATEVPNYLNQNFGNINTEVTTLSANAVKTVNGKKATNNNINISEFDSYWKASETVTVGDVRFLGGRENSGIVLECVKTGTTGSTQPTVSDYVGMGGSGGEIESVLSAIETVQTQVNGINSSMSGITDYIVESYRNGTEWYEVYKSGKVRQGGYLEDGKGVDSSNGKATLTYLKPFANTNYQMFMQENSNFSDTTYNTNAQPYINTKTTTSCEVYCSGARYHKTYWVAEGQGA